MLKIILIGLILCGAWADEYHPKDMQSMRHLIKKMRYHPQYYNYARYAPHRYYNYRRNAPQTVDEKIVGGEETTIEDLPYQMSLRYITSHTCGAAVLDEWTAITAAHCVYGRRGKSFTLKSGTTYINDNTHPGKLSFVDRVIMHEDYNATSQANDIAILKFFMPLVLNDKIKPVALPDAGDAVAPQTEAVVSGWGKTEEGTSNPPGPFALRKATVAVLSRSECEEAYPDKLTTSMMCAQTSGRDSCQGDSGGPLVADNKLVGVVSWGYGCARPEYPGVYTSIAAMRPWIDSHRNC